MNTPDHTENNGNYRYCLYLLPEYDKPDWDFESEEDEQETLRKIDSGALLWFCAKVTFEAKMLGKWVELGADHLGQCCYASIEDFINDGYYTDMKAIALELAKVARTNILELEVLK